MNTNTKQVINKTAILVTALVVSYFVASAIAMPNFSLEAVLLCSLLTTLTTIVFLHLDQISIWVDKKGWL